MAGRPRIFDEETALKKAAGLFWERGYEATSTENLIEKMGVQRGSFYHAFNSKKALFQSALAYHEEASLNELRKLLKASTTPIQVIKSIFLGIADCHPHEHKKGCFAGNTVAELSSVDEDLVENAKKYLKDLEEIFYKQIKLSQETGELKTRIEAKLLSRYLLNLWNGINLTRRIYPGKQALLGVIELHLEILK